MQFTRILTPEEINSLPEEELQAYTAWVQGKKQDSLRKIANAKEDSRKLNRIHLELTHEEALLIDNDNINRIRQLLHNGINPSVSNEGLI
ncbi:MAG: hypothetical protein NTZ80_01385 [Patescibacteria group bacterium]|nr:hypothetical protein [Patescibacteria group bacterium]